MAMSDTLVAEAGARAIFEEILFQPVRLGRYELPHRIAMAPLTRSRARQPGNVRSTPATTRSERRPR